MNSPLAYIGGKSKLAKTIIELIPEHKTYCEVFGGALWVFFKKEPSRYEVVNDLDSDLITFYRVIQNHTEEFLKQYKWLLSSRELFNDFKGQLEENGFTDIQRAARYYYVQRLAFAGRPKNRAYGTATERKPRINLLRIEEDMSEVHLRLSGVQIENLPWQNLIKKYDRPGTFFYLDPPYYNRKDYSFNFTHDGFVEMAGILSTVQGKWLLSIDDRPETREIFKQFRLNKAEVQYSAAVGKRMMGKELIIQPGI